MRWAATSLGFYFLVLRLPSLRAPSPGVALLTFASKSEIVGVPNNLGVSPWPFSKNASRLSPVSETEMTTTNDFERRACPDRRKDRRLRAHRSGHAGRTLPSPLLATRFTCPRNSQKGRIVPIRILSEDLALYRGESGTAHVISNECPHRLTRLHIGWIEGETVRCRYHGWRFDEIRTLCRATGRAETFLRPCAETRLLSHARSARPHLRVFRRRRATGLSSAAGPRRWSEGRLDGLPVGRNDPVQLFSERGEHHGRRPCELRASRSPREHGGAAVHSDQNLGRGNAVRPHAIPAARRENRQDPLHHAEPVLPGSPAAHGAGRQAVLVQGALLVRADR